MFSLFRKQRAQAGQEGTLVRYLKYAVGEIILVVVGILIALQINDWYQDRLDRKTERSYLVSMQQELVEDSQNLHATIEGNTHLLAGIDELLKLLAEPREDEAYQRRLYLHTLKYGYWFVEMEFSELTMAQLKYSGGLGLITDHRVKQAMMAYERGMTTVKRQTGQVMAYFHEYEASQKALFNPLLSKQAFEYIEVDYMRMLDPLESFEPLVPAGPYIIGDEPGLWTDYYGDMLYFKTALNNNTLLMRRQIELAQALSSLITEQYGISD